jgi:hypothetical protein
MGRGIDSRGGAWSKRGRGTDARGTAWTQEGQSMCVRPPAHGVSLILPS